MERIPQSFINLNQQQQQQATPKIKMPQVQDEAPLNAYYYGPSVPPQLKHDYTIRRRSGGSCCSCSTFLKLIFTLFILLGIAVLVSWIILRPQKPKWNVVDADLKQMDLTNDNTVNYDFSLNMAVRNPNKKVGVYYDRIEASAFYKGKRLSWRSLPGFYQGHKNTTDLHAEFQGQQLVMLSGNEIDQFNQEKNNGFFYIDVKVNLRVRYKVGGIKTRRTKPDVECKLRIPLASSNGTITRRFESTRCDFDF